MMSSRMRPVFVVLEGLDGAGKTTCARELALILGAEYMTTPAPKIREFCRAMLESFGGCQESAQLFYLSTVFAASLKVREALVAGKSVVMDRYFLSTQVYAEFRGSGLPLDALGDSLVPATHTIYLDVPLAVRRERLSKRNCTEADRETLGPEADGRLHALYFQKAGLSVVGKWSTFAGDAQSPVDLASSIAARILRGVV